MYQNPGLLNDIVGALPLPVAVYTGDSLKVEIANPAMIRTWGKGDQVIGKNYPDIVPEIQDQQIIDQALTVLKTGIPFHAKNKKVDLVIQGVMTEHYFNYSFIPLFNEKGEVYGVLNTGADVTDLHQAKEEAKSANEKLTMAIDAAGLGTYEIDLATKTVKTSGNFNAIWSIEKEVSNEELIARLHPDDLPVREKAHEQALITGKISYETRILQEDHSVKWTKINGKIINDQQGNPKTIIGIIQDIQEQRAFEEELKKQVVDQTEELQRSNNDLLHFAGIVSHDLREPVRKIKIFNTLLSNEKKPGFYRTSKKYLSKINHSAQRMENIIEGILTYSTLDKTAQSFEKIDLNEILENIKTDLELVIQEKDAVLITSELPEIEGASILINQLFYNLIQNALKFSKADVPPRVIITSGLINDNGVDCVKIIIKDNGIGLDPAFNERIFNAFERLHSKDQYEGNGLGLALCRKIVKRHNGSITAAGEKDNGAEFTVILPLRHEDKIS
ncbi:PAS domain S-box protein [Flavobacterium sp. 17A]|uniref:histidine kinase n=1 Tax=Flavobacterium potami TaxID=2872310 RepID=A0A9X1HBC9_9FLAO|nr:MULTISPECIES: ATP-binding protein [Flavobacterium]MBZ4035307.1 PAS domain S-box protein [Flavobacterium potami]WET02463.1 ATP-binding protein [Flavobacterium sp. YJ01]